MRDIFLVSLLVDGVLAGAIYALVALAFVVVYKASRMINFALGEWAMLGSRLVATGLHALGLGLGVLESLAAGYLDPLLGGGFSNIASYLVLIAMLFARPYGMFGRPAVERV
jgi:branched-subunit amino acid ABC-type transport system permease component